MFEPIFSPLNYYLNTAKNTHAGYTQEYLKLLSNEAKLDREANAKTVAELHSYELAIQQLQSKSAGKKTGKTLIIIALCLAFFVFAIWCFTASIGEVWKCVLLLGGLGAMIFGIVFTCKKMNAKIRALEAQIAELLQKANEVRNEAWTQAAPLNNLFQDDDSLNLFTKTLPFITFDKCFTHTRLYELVDNYGFPSALSNEECTIDTLSGELYGSPFAYVQKLCHRMGTKTYSGSITITWTTTERDSKGNLVTRHHSQVLTATISRPAPYYHKETALYFGNKALPNLNFSRTYAHMEDKSESAIAKAVRKGEKKIKKLEEEALKTGDDFQGVTNTEFDVLFGATNRTDDLEFLQMFTPRAQESMLELLLYKEGYGDDFSFVKYGNLCIIQSEHAQGKPLFPIAAAYQSYDISKAESNFLQKNETFFRSVYFDFAPLLLIPAYQQPLVRSEPITAGNLTAYNFEAISKRLSSCLAPDGAQTESIFKTSLEKHSSNEDMVQVCAHAYDTVQRVHYESVYGRDGRWHTVPVYWTEYIPISKTSTLRITKEKLEDQPTSGAYYRGYYAYKA
jgi:hypothetical protein